MLTRKHISLLLMLLIVAVISFFTCTNAGAATANCDGSCSADEIANHTCAMFGSNVIEFCGASAGSCALDTGGSAPCTLFFYKYTGTATNQVNVAIPIGLTQTLNSAPDVHCSQYYTDGGGDPTTGFGSGLSTLGICRTANNVANLPTGITPAAPSTANFWIQTDPSYIDKKTPLNWRVRQSKTEVYDGTVVGPVTSQAEVAETTMTLTTKDGVNCTWSIVGGQPVLVNCPTGTLVPGSSSKICLPATDPSKITFTNASGSYTCETISYVSEKCDIKTTGTDPVVWYNGTWIKY